MPIELDDTGMNFEFYRQKKLLTKTIGQLFMVHWFVTKSLTLKVFTLTFFASQVLARSDVVQGKFQTVCIREAFDFLSHFIPRSLALYLLMDKKKQ